MLVALLRGSHHQALPRSLPARPFRLKCQRDLQAHLSARLLRRPRHAALPGDLPRASALLQLRGKLDLPPRLPARLLRKHRYPVLRVHLQQLLGDVRLPAHRAVREGVSRAHPRLRAKFHLRQLVPLPVLLLRCDHQRLLALRSHLRRLRINHHLPRVRVRLQPLQRLLHEILPPLQRSGHLR